MMDQPTLTDMALKLNSYPGTEYQNWYFKQLHDNVAELHKQMINQNLTGTYDFPGTTVNATIPIDGLTTSDHYTLTIVSQTNAAHIVSQSVPTAGNEINVTFNVDPGVTKFSYIIKKGSD